jgi:hypothetical protein
VKETCQGFHSDIITDLAVLVFGRIATASLAFASMAVYVKLARSLVNRIPHKRGVRDSVAMFSSVLRGFGYLCAYPKHRHMECITPNQTDPYILKETGQPI